MMSSSKTGKFLIWLFLFAYDIAMLFAAISYTILRGIIRLGLWKNRKFYIERLCGISGLDIDINKHGKNSRVYWLHAVSVGETVAAKSLIRELRKQDPTAIIIQTAVTDTGWAEAKKNSELDYVFAHPFDYSFAARKFVKQIKPDILILVEGDFWLQHMRAVVASGSASIYVVNGKISESSVKHYKRFPGYAALIFNCITHIYAQADVYAQRFSEVGFESQRVSVVGNIKLDSEVVSWSEHELTQLKCELGLVNNNSCGNRIITFGSSHPGENEIFISIMQRILVELADTRFLLVPRHPDRAHNVKGLFEKYGIPYRYYSEMQIENNTKNTSVEVQAVCVDVIGYLDRLYRITDIAVIGGTFVQVGGHNILEPGRYGVPVIYGPYIFKQPGLHELVKETGAGVQVFNEDGLYQALLDYIRNTEVAEKAGLAGRTINENAAGLSGRIIESILTDVQARK